MTNATNPHDGNVIFGIPRNKRQARSWVRQHWAYVIEKSDMGAIADLNNKYIEHVYQDECDKIAERLRK